jgi:hypothetical protein
MILNRMTKKLPFLFVCILILPFHFLFAQQLEVDTSMWITNGPVTDIVRSGNTIYLAGNFTHVGPNTGNGVILNQSDGKVVSAPSFKINGPVRTTVSDGRGGWYIGGDFTSVQGVARNKLAHILANGTLDQIWNPDANAAVLALAVFGNVVYVGGEFSSIGGQLRNRLAALDVTTGQATPWNPNPNYRVLALAIARNVVYVGGDFTNISGQPRNYVAALDIATGQATAWNPNAIGRVTTLAIAGNVVYVGGLFTSMGGQSRNRLAALDATTGLATAWNPNPNGKINTLAVSENIVYVGGEFTTIGGQSRNYIAALNITTGQVTAWNPNANSQIITLAIAGNVVYVGGLFTRIEGQPRNYVAALNITTGQVTAWNPNASDVVLALAVSGNVAYVGGEFSSIGGQLRNRLAALDVTTGQATPWNPNPNGNVYALAIAGNVVYVGGTSTTIGGQNRRGIAALDATTGQATAWNPNPNGAVYAFTIVGNVVYVGGLFTSIGGQSRNHLAALDATTGLATAWNPDASGTVQALAVSENIVYVGGEFTTIGGQSRNYIAALNITTGQVTAWNPNANSRVITLAIAGNVVYVGGDFTRIEGQSRNYIAALDAATGQATTWNPNADNRVLALAISEKMVYVGGYFSSIGSQPRNRLVALDVTTGRATPWNPNANELINVVYAIDVSGNVVYVGREFISLPDRNTKYFVAYGRPGALSNLIKGNIYEDINGDCVRNSNEKGIANRVVVAQPGNYFTSSDSLGNYTLRVDTGNYTIEQVIPFVKAGSIKQVCPVNPATHSVRFTASQDTLIGKDFANQTTLRSYLTVSVSSDRRRRCMSSSTTVSYCNSGTAGVENAKVYVKLPEYVVLKSASIAYTLGKDNNYVFNIGTLPADACGSISIQDSVICGNSSIRDLTQCTKAWITPANNRTPSGNWDQSDISLKAKCLENGRVRLAIYNTGNGHMADSSAFRIYLDAQLVFKANYKLAKGDSLILQVPANGQTLRLEADQRPFHPSRIQSHITVEACGTNSIGTVSKGYVNQQPQEEEEPEIATECLPIIDSFDPNDKLVSPQGVTAEHYTPTGVDLQYKIRFQNTGTDVAYKVVVVDTISENLDISTLKIGAISHPYKLSVSGKGRPVLTFTFENIMLPDSNRNEPQSHGYISLNIKPKKELAEKTVIENFADIFFDYNEPVRTNTTVNTIYDMPAVVTEGAKLTEQVICHRTNMSVDGGVNRIICEKDTVILQSAAPLYGKGRWKQIKGSGQIQDVENPYTLVKDLGYGENTFEWSIAANTCGTDSLTASVTILSVEQPATPIILQLGVDSLSCNLQASAYEWLVDGHTLQGYTQTMKVSQNGSYAVRITDTAGCSSAWSIPFVYMPTGLSADIAEKVSIHPNPSNGYFILSLPAGFGTRVQITITDAVGRKIYEQTLIHSERIEYTKELDLSSQAPGIYVVKLYSEKGMIIKKVLKK